MEQTNITRFASEFLLTHTQSVLWEREINFLLKRLLDIVLSLAGLIIGLPVALIVMILIRLDSPGPVFFVQNRVGTRRYIQNGRECWESVIFRMYKFRTMFNKADPAIHRAYVQALIKNDEQEMQALQGGDNHIKKLVKDPRITRLGHILRKTSLDELPQLINVFKGEMSLVGPRPALEYEVENYQPWHLKRLKAKPGITGLQQVKARCLDSFDQQVLLDIQYTEQFSIFLDLKIIMLTPLVVFTGRGAH